MSNNNQVVELTENAKILDRAPETATLYNGSFYLRMYCGLLQYYAPINESWGDVCGNRAVHAADGMRSLKDIKQLTIYENLTSQHKD